MLHNNYVVSEKDMFNIANYIDVENELCAISGNFPAMFASEKADIVISYLKDHSIKKTLVEQNTIFVKQLVFSSLKTGNIEALFVACKTNSIFLADFELYIRHVFK